MIPMHALRARHATALALAAFVAAWLGCGRGGPKETAQAGEANSAERGPTEGLRSAPGEAKARPGTEHEPKENRPPKARFEIYPLEGLTRLTGITFDASFSSDDYNLSSELRHRWDFDGDGTWDTGFTGSERTTYVYPTTGRYRPRLEVRDAGGRADSVVGPELYIHPPCPAPDFALTDVNPNSRSFGRPYRLSELRGKPVMAWFVAPTK